MGHLPFLAVLFFWTVGVFSIIDVRAQRNEILFGNAITNETNPRRVSFGELKELPKWARTFGLEDDGINDDKVDTEMEVGRKAFRVRSKRQVYGPAPPMVPKPDPCPGLAQTCPFCMTSLSQLPHSICLFPVVIKGLLLSLSSPDYYGRQCGKIGLINSSGQTPISQFRRLVHFSLKGGCNCNLVNGRKYYLISTHHPWQKDGSFWAKLSFSDQVYLAPEDRYSDTELSKWINQCGPSAAYPSPAPPSPYMQPGPAPQPSYRQPAPLPQAPVYSVPAPPPLPPPPPPTYPTPAPPPTYPVPAPPPPAYPAPAPPPSYPAPAPPPSYPVPAPPPSYPVPAPPPSYPVPAPPPSYPVPAPPPSYPAPAPPPPPPSYPVPAPPPSYPAPAPPPPPSYPVPAPPTTTYPVPTPPPLYPVSIPAPPPYKQPAPPPLYPVPVPSPPYKQPAPSPTTSYPMPAPPPYRQPIPPPYRQPVSPPPPYIQPAPPPRQMPISYLPPPPQYKIISPPLPKPVPVLPQPSSPVTAVNCILSDTSCPFCALYSKTIVDKKYCESNFAYVASIDTRAPDSYKSYAREGYGGGPCLRRTAKVLFDVSRRIGPKPYVANVDLLIPRHCSCTGLSGGPVVVLLLGIGSPAPLGTTQLTSYYNLFILPVGDVILPNCKAPIIPDPPVPYSTLSPVSAVNCPPGIGNSCPNCYPTLDKNLENFICSPGAKFAFKAHINATGALSPYAAVSLPTVTVTSIKDSYSNYDKLIKITVAKPPDLCRKGLIHVYGSYSYAFTDHNQPYFTLLTCSCPALNRPVGSAVLIASSSSPKLIDGSLLLTKDIYIAPIPDRYVFPCPSKGSATADMVYFGTPAPPPILYRPPLPPPPILYRPPLPPPPIIYKPPPPVYRPPLPPPPTPPPVYAPAPPVYAPTPPPPVYAPPPPVYTPAPPPPPPVYTPAPPPPPPVYTPAPPPPPPPPVYAPPPPPPVYAPPPPPVYAPPPPPVYAPAPPPPPPPPPPVYAPAPPPPPPPPPVYAPAPPPPPPVYAPAPPPPPPPPVYAPAPPPPPPPPVYAPPPPPPPPVYAPPPPPPPPVYAPPPPPPVYAPPPPPPVYAPPPPPPPPVYAPAPPPPPPVYAPVPPPPPPAYAPTPPPPLPPSVYEPVPPPTISRPSPQPLVPTHEIPPASQSLPSYVPPLYQIPLTSSSLPERCISPNDETCPFCAVGYPIPKSSYCSATVALVLGMTGLAKKNPYDTCTAGAAKALYDVTAGKAATKHVADVFFTVRKTCTCPLLDGYGFAIALIKHPLAITNPLLIHLNSNIELYPLSAGNLQLPNCGTPVGQLYQRSSATDQAVLLPSVDNEVEELFQQVDDSFDCPDDLELDSCPACDLYSNEELNDIICSRTNAFLGYTYGNETFPIMAERLQNELRVLQFTSPEKYGISLELTPKNYSICDLPMDHGSCNSFDTRFYYNSVKRKCVPFEFSGCSGNENNFQTLQSCKLACSAQEKCRSGYFAVSVEVHDAKPYDANNDFLSYTIRSDCNCEHLYTNGTQIVLIPAGDVNNRDLVLNKHAYVVPLLDRQYIRELNCKSIVQTSVSTTTKSSSSDVDSLASTDSFVVTSLQDDDIPRTTVENKEWETFPVDKNETS